MPRVLNWPIDIPIIKLTALSGPETVSDGATQSMTGFTQTFASPFGAWKWKVDLGPMLPAQARSWRSLITGLHGGANGLRMQIPEEWPLSWSQMGANVSGYEFYEIPCNWSNNKPWSNNMPWQAGKPSIPVALSASKGDTIISLSPTLWGGVDPLNVRLGFYPFHFGMYVITETISLGKFRIWPPLRKSITTTDYATLEPTMIMRMESKTSAPYQAEGGGIAENMSIVLTEVEDEDARHFYQF